MLKKLSSLKSSREEAVLNFFFRYIISQLPGLRPILSHKMGDSGKIEVFLCFSENCGAYENDRIVKSETKRPKNACLMRC